MANRNNQTRSKRGEKSTGNYSFARIPSANIPRSKFDRSSGLKTTFDSGYLIPIFCDEALPGDTMSMNLSTFARMSTPLHPVMDTLKLDTFFFAVPIRLIWDNWQKFMGEQTDPGDSTDYLVPTVSPGTTQGPPGTLWDYFGLPIPYALDEPKVCAFWHRAYNLIFNEWFRDQNLVQSLPVPKDDGPDDPTAYKLLKRGKRHDYFTSSLPWPQKGPAVELPLGQTAPVTLNNPNWFDAVGITSGTPTWDVNGASNLGLQKGVGNQDVQWTANANAGLAAVWDNPQLHTNIGGAAGTVDLSGATAATINQLREAFQIQKLYERDARGGTRYTEILRSHFGVMSPDARLQRPEYLGGGTTGINFTPIPQTSNTISSGADASPQGTLAAYATSADNFPGWIKSFTEHCVILGMACVRADLNYQQCIPRMFSRQTKWDFYWPALAHLGEQTVLKKELYYDNTATDNEVFGYQERWAEYRYKPSQITGKMRSPVGAYNDSLDTWHLAQAFTTHPALNETFIQEDPPVDRVLAVLDQPQFIFDAYFNFQCTRPMPTYSVPGLIDHF